MNGRLSAFLHSLAHRLDPGVCACHVDAYQKAWKAQRDAELRQVEARTPDELDAAFRRLIADGEWQDWAA